MFSKVVTVLLMISISEGFGLNVRYKRQSNDRHYSSWSQQKEKDKTDVKQTGYQQPTSTWQSDQYYQNYKQPYSSTTYQNGQFNQQKYSGYNREPSSAQFQSEGNPAETNYYHAYFSLPVMLAPPPQQQMSQQQMHQQQMTQHQAYHPVQQENTGSYQKEQFQHTYSGKQSSQLQEQAKTNTFNEKGKQSGSQQTLNTQNLNQVTANQQQAQAQQSQPIAYKQNEGANNGRPNSGNRNPGRGNGRNPNKKPKKPKNPGQSGESGESGETEGGSEVA